MRREGSQTPGFRYYRWSDHHGTVPDPQQLCAVNYAFEFWSQPVCDCRPSSCCCLVCFWSIPCLFASRTHYILDKPAIWEEIHLEELAEEKGEGGSLDKSEQPPVSSESLGQAGWGTEGCRSKLRNMRLEFVKRWPYVISTRCWASGFDSPSHEWHFHCVTDARAVGKAGRAGDGAPEFRARVLLWESLLDFRHVA